MTSRSTATLNIHETLNITGATVINSGALTFPTSTTNIVGSDTVDTLTNKTIIGPSNNIEANTLRSTSWTVPLLGPAPKDGQQLTYSATNNGALWVSTEPTITILQTTNSKPTNIVNVATVSSKIYLIEARILAKRTNGNATAIFKLAGAFKAEANGVLSQIGSTDITSFVSPKQTMYSADFSIDSINVVTTVTGAENNTVDWKCELSVIEN